MMNNIAARCVFSYKIKRAHTIIHWIRLCLWAAMTVLIGSPITKICSLLSFPLIKHAESLSSAIRPLRRMIQRRNYLNLIKSFKYVLFILEPGKKVNNCLFLCICKIYFQVYSNIANRISVPLTRIWFLHILHNLNF